MEWLALIIPAIVSVILLQWFRSKVVWWEFVILFAITPIVILLCKFGAEASMTTDTEYWGAYAVDARYYEHWNEEVPCSHAVYRTEYYTDSKGNSHSREVFSHYEHLYDVDEHPEYWRMYDNVGSSHYITKTDYRTLKSRWNNEVFKDQHRDYHDNDGDMYKTTFDNKDKHLEAITTVHTYKNKVQASSSVFNFPEVKDPASMGLYDYPKVSGSYAPAILGNVHDKVLADRYLEIQNAKLGSSHQVRIWFIFFTSDMSLALEQENYWKGGNKNEFVVCVGLDKEQNVTWCKPFTWCEVDELTALVRNEFASHDGKIDTVKLAKYTVEQVKKKWERKQFAEFEYLTVVLPMSAYIIIWLITILVNVGIGVYVIKNDITEESETKRKWRRR